MKRLCVVFLVIAMVASAQSKSDKKSGGGGSSSTSSGDSSGGGGGGGAPVETEMMAYESVAVLADRIVSEAIRTIMANDKKTPPPACTSKSILLTDPTAQAEISAFFSFKSLVTALNLEYQGLGPRGGGPLSVSPTDWISAGTSFLTAIRNSATFSGQTFQPDDTVLATLLAKKFSSKDYKLVSAHLPGDNKKAADDIVAMLKKVSDARSRVIASQRDTDYFKGLDKQWDSLQASLTATDSNGNTILTLIINGQALSTSLGDCYSQLFAKTVAAGGSSRTNHNFWVELFYTTPKPSYNGGAIVSYSLLATDGTFLTAETIRDVYDYSKWKADKVKHNKNF